jgi:heavy metal sensor kinase
VRIRASSVRSRLTVWYTLVLAFIVLVFSFSVYFFVKGRLFRQLNEQLDKDFSVIAEDVSAELSDVRELESEGSSKLFFQLSQGKDVYYQTGSYQKAGLPEILSMPTSKYQTIRSKSGKRFHLMTGSTKNGFLLTVAQDEEAIRSILHTLFMILALALPSALVLAALGGYIMASRLLKPVASMASKAEKISSENLSERLPVENPEDELGKLATIFNHTLTRLQDAFERLQRFTADASHELRTPLTAIQSVGEVALQEDLDASAYRDTIGSMLEETARLARLVDSLLLLTRADRGQLLVNRKEQNVTRLVEKAIEDMQVMAEEKSQSLMTNLTSGIQANVDEDSLRRAVVNILDNAIKYTARAGTIFVALKEIEGKVIIEVTDTGPGIAAEHREKIFDRFYRVEKDRSREIGGAGLGLAIAKWAVEANAGRLELDSQENQGSTFRIILPK